MFGIGWTEFIIIFLVLLIFVGPRHFPDLLRRFGQIVGELRLASRELRNQLDVDLKDVESPRAAAARAGRELLDSWDSPYGDDEPKTEGYAPPPRLDQAGPPAEDQSLPTAKKKPDLEPDTPEGPDESPAGSEESDASPKSGTRGDDGGDQ